MMWMSDGTDIITITIHPMGMTKREQRESKAPGIQEGIRRIDKVIRALIKGTLTRFGYQIQRIIALPLWEDDDDFNSLRAQLVGHTLVDRPQCYMLYQYAKHVVALPGDVAEVGVYKGGTARLLAKALESTGKTVHLFDTFSGIPSSDPGRDIHKTGNFSDTSLESVEAYLRDCGNVRFYQGLFPDTAKPLEETRFCLVHIDVDIYRSAMECCKFFYPRMQNGGMMIFDDYGIHDCPGIKMAVDEFFGDKVENPCYLPTGQCVVTRTCILR